MKTSMMYCSVGKTLVLLVPILYHPKNMLIQKKCLCQNRRISTIHCMLTAFWKIILSNANYNLFPKSLEVMPIVSCSTVKLYIYRIVSHSIWIITILKRKAFWNLKHLYASYVKNWDFVLDVLQKKKKINCMNYRTVIVAVTINWFQSITRHCQTLFDCGLNSSTKISSLKGW